MGGIVRGCALPNQVLQREVNLIIKFSQPDGESNLRFERCVNQNHLLEWFHSNIAINDVFKQTSTVLNWGPQTFQQSRESYFPKHEM